MPAKTQRILVLTIATILIITLHSNYTFHKYCGGYVPGKTYTEYLNIGDYCSHFRSEVDQDRFIYQNYFIDNIYAGEGTFVEVGYNKGSFTLFFEKTLGWNGVIINNQKVDSNNFHSVGNRKAIKVGKNRKGINQYQKLDEILATLNIDYVNFLTINLNTVALSELASLNFNFYAEVVNFHFVKDFRLKRVENDLDKFMASKNYTIYFILEWQGTAFDYFYVPAIKKPFVPNNIRMECMKLECF
ncbi:hypothetical protein HDV06_006410 [Boothiomyces sp. JEL0866]|nr:hypothetical protein HDV06_006410 [Boothiomyces sp. JEL0866]